MTSEQNAPELTAEEIEEKERLLASRVPMKHPEQSDLLEFQPPSDFMEFDEWIYENAPSLLAMAKRTLAAEAEDLPIVRAR